MTKSFKKFCLGVLLVTLSFVLPFKTHAKKRNLTRQSSNTLDFVSALKQTDLDVSPQSDLFLNSLAREYKSFALYKNENTKDFNGANRFALKALKAHTGEKVDPINVYKVRLPATSAIRITKLYDDFIFLFDNNLDVKYPVLMSEAQAKFDCWIDSETSRNTEQAKKCFQRFEKALGYLYEKLEKICNQKCQDKQKREKERNRFPDKKTLVDGGRILIGTNNPLGLKTRKFSTYLNRDVEVLPISSGGFKDKKPKIIEDSPFVRPIEKVIKTNSLVKEVPINQMENVNKTTIINHSTDNSNIQLSLNRIEKLLIHIAGKIDNLKNVDKDNLNNIKQKMEEVASSLNNSNNTPEEIKSIEDDALTLQNEVETLETKSLTITNNKNISNDLKTKDDKEIIEIVEEEQIITSVKNVPKKNDDENEEEVEEKDTEDEKENTEEETISDVSTEQNKIENESSIEEEVEEENIEQPSSIFKTIKKEDNIETEVKTQTSKLLPYELFFDWNKADVKSKYNNELKTITNNVLKSKEMIVIQGHTDATGTPEYNKILSKVRAENVGRIVMSYGVPRNKILMQGMGDTLPKVPNKPGERKAENRRVVIK